MDAAPTHYDLEFEPNFGDFTFRGTARIRAQCAGAATAIRLDAAELRIESCTVSDGDGETEARTRSDENGESLHVELPRAASGEIVMTIRYTGTLNDRLLGFYRSSYTRDGQTKYVATTQFEAADARRAFPCWDEPRRKATFDVTIVVPEGMTAVSNMPVLNATKRGGRTAYRFERTPVMSTYLLYLGAGDFEYLDDGGPIRVVTVPGKSKQGRYALETASRLLPEFEEYFGTKYPLPKLDLLALPDFAAGAMENWGAITFRESLLLYDGNDSSTMTRQRIAEVISHELAHQWFGNLVTMEWWNDLWLNESFATFMATKMLDRIHPEWNLWDQFLDESANGAMDMDALRATHPIDVGVDSPSQIREIFDAISYDKGGCVLRMLEGHAGGTAFRDGLRLYLGRFEYGNAAGGDLWECIAETSGKGVRAVVETWLRLEGFPVVAAAPSGDDVALGQERFLAAGPGGPDSGVWPIPVKYGGGKKTETLLMEGATASVRRPQDFVANTGRAGFYRVQYMGELYEDIKSMAERGALSPRDMWGAQNDAFAFCVGGRIGVRDYLDLVSRYGPDGDYLPLVDTCRNLSVLLNAAEGGGWRDHVAGRAKPLLSGILERLGWRPSAQDPHTHAFLRATAIKALGLLGDRDVVSRAAAMTDSFADSPGSVHPDLREPAFWVAAGAGDANLHSRMKTMFVESDSIEERLRILSGMCGFRDTALMRATLDFALSDAVRSQNVQLPILRTAANPRGYGMLWPWLHGNWDRVEGKAGRGNPILARIIHGMAPALTLEQGGHMEGFFGGRPVPGTERAVSQAAEIIRIRDGFRRRAALEFGSGSP